MSAKNLIWENRQLSCFKDIARQHVLLSLVLEQTLNTFFVLDL